MILNGYTGGQEPLQGREGYDEAVPIEGGQGDRLAARLTARSDDDAPAAAEGDLRRKTVQWHSVPWTTPSLHRLLSTLNRGPDLSARAELLLRQRQLLLRGAGFSPLRLLRLLLLLLLLLLMMTLAGSSLALRRRRSAPFDEVGARAAPRPGPEALGKVLGGRAR